MRLQRAVPRYRQPRIATASEWGLSRRQLERDPRMIWLPACVWMRCPKGVDAKALESWELACILQPALGPNAAVGHISAAQVWQIPLSERVTWIDELLQEPHRSRELDGRPHFSYSAARRNQSTSSFVMHKGLGLPVEPGPWGVPVTHPVETVVALHHQLVGWRAVAALDHVLATGTQYLGGTQASKEEIHQLLSELPARTRGVERTRRALDLAVPHVWSPMETVLRLWVVQCGFPVPEANWPIALPSGRRAVVDLAWVHRRVALEYNGGVHYRDRQAYGDEMFRLHQLQDLGWQVRLVVAEDLRDPYRRAQLVRWLRAALGASRG